MTFSKKNYKSFRNETEFKQEVANNIKEEYGDDVWYYLPSDRFRKGIPDIILCFFGYFVAIELKMPNSDEKGGSPLQRYNLNRIKGANGFSLTAVTMDEVMGGLRNIYDVIQKT